MTVYMPDSKYKQIEKRKTDLGEGIGKTIKRMTWARDIFVHWGPYQVLRESESDNNEN